MRYKNIIAFFLVVLPVSIGLRFMQLVFTVDATTGFFKQEYKPIGYALIFIIFFACAITALLSFTAFRKPEKPPKVNPFLGFASLLLGFAIGYEIITETFVAAVRVWQIVLLDVTGLLAAVFFIIYGLKMLIDFPLPGITTIIIPIYWVVRLICIFTTISSLSLISDTVITLAYQCSALIFMACFAKIFNKINDDKLFRKVLASGLITAILCLADSVPRLYLKLTNHEQYLHSSATSSLTMLATGIFAFTFILAFFSNKNLKERKRGRRTRSVKNGGFYIHPENPPKREFM